MRLELELNKPSIYYPGQRITGVVNIIMQVPGKIRILRLRFIGCEETSWFHVNASSKDDAVDLSSFSSEIFLNEEQYYIGEKYKDADFEISTGVTSVFFNYKLPKSIPSSYKGVHGHVEYKVEAHIETSLGDRDRKTFFDVKGIYNLTQLLPALRLFSPKEESMAIETVNLFCKSNGNVEVFFYLSKIAYGEKIPFYSKITNNSKFSVNVYINLVRYVTYNIKGSAKQEGEFRVFTFRKSDKVKSGREDVFENDSNSFRVPKDCVPNNLGRREGIGLISVKYNVELSLKVSSHFQNSLVIPIPIYIGGVAKRIVPEKEDSLDESGKSQAGAGSEMSIHSKTESRITARSIASSISKVFKSKKPRKISEGELTSKDTIFPSTKSSKSSRKSKSEKSYATSITSTSTSIETLTQTQDKISTKDNESSKTTTKSTSENEPDKIPTNPDNESESDTNTDKDKIPNNSESE